MLRKLSSNILKQNCKLFSTSFQPEQFMHVPETEVSTLNNGLRVVSENWKTKTSTVGIFVNAGSRYETAKNNGVAHFIEHMAFKGTNKRTQHSLELEVETKGARLNAYTSREMTVFYFQCLNKDVEWAVELLSDILRNSTFEKRQIERERGVILREMEEIESIYQEYLFDHLHASAFRGSTLGQTILGPEENIRALDVNDLKKFISTHYHPPNMILTSVGGLPHEQLAELGAKYFGYSSPHGIYKKEELKEFLQSDYVGSDVRLVNNRLPQAHLAFASHGPGWTDPDTLPLMIACSVNGSWDRNYGGMGQSNSSLVRKFFQDGNVHSFQNFFTCYHDTSLWGIYMTCDKTGLKETADAILEEWLRICTEITDEEVERAKNSFKTNLLLSLDGTKAVCEEIGRHMITYNRRIPPHEMVYRIDNVSSQQVRDTCTKYIRNKDLSVSSIGPIEALPDYNYMKQRLHW